MFDEAVIAEAGRRLARAAPEAQVILFGSYARGDAGPHSDLDFLVVQTGLRDPAAESVRLRRVLRGLSVSADIFVVDESYVAEWRDVRGTLVNAALAEGRVLAPA